MVDVRFPRRPPRGFPVPFMIERLVNAVSGTKNSRQPTCQQGVTLGSSDRRRPMDEFSWQDCCRGWWLAFSRAGFSRAWERAIAQDNEEEMFLLLAAKVPARGVRPSFLEMSLRCANPSKWAESLLACGASPDAEAHGVFRQTWLSVAASMGCSSVVGALLAGGADPNLRKDFNPFPLEACFFSWPKKGEVSGFRQAALLMLEKGASVRPKTMEVAPLDEQVFRALLAAGAKPNRKFVLNAFRLLTEPNLSIWASMFDRAGWGASSGVWGCKPLVWSLVSKKPGYRLPI